MFADRAQAGRRLGARLADESLVDPVVLALPRGGVPVGYEVARSRNAPLDLLLVRKVGAPSQPELAVGAIAEGGEPLLDEDLLTTLGLTAAELAETLATERAELERRTARYRRGRPAAALAGRDVIVVDDGLATGATARAALRAARSREPRRLVLAAPVCATDAVRSLARDADDVVCLEQPRDFAAVGQWYRDFTQTTDDEVIALLDRAEAARAS